MHAGRKWHAGYRALRKWAGQVATCRRAARRLRYLRRWQGRQAGHSERRVDDDIRVDDGGRDCKNVGVVVNCAARVDILRVCKGPFTERRHHFRFLALLLFLAVAGGSASAKLDVGNASATLPVTASLSARSAGSDSPFALADFDGDLQPDLASVQAGANNQDKTDYRIQLELSTAGRESIRLVAPSGGLEIEARDVNGDHAIDLVVSTAGNGRPVAIFLNDGHGTFSRAEPAAFPGAFGESKTNWAAAPGVAANALGVTPQSGSNISSNEKDSLHDRSPAGFVAPSSAGFPLNFFIASHAGRAPPFAVRHS
jgi:hypothetical protein